VTRRRRACLLLGLAIVLGALAASNVSHREAALRAQLGPLTEVVVARKDLPARRVLSLSDLGVRAVPSRYAPTGEPVFAAALAGHRLAVPVAAGAPVTADLLEREPRTPETSVRRGERAVDVIAAGSAQAVVEGAHVDVVVTAEHRARLALTDVQVLAAHAAPAKDGQGPQVVATLRVSVEQAVYLVAAQSFARNIRLLVRAPGDTRAPGDLTVGDTL
jgi:pilus assembly protein CpaB